MGMFKKKRKERNTPVGPSPGRGGLRLQRRPLGKWRLREGGLESAQWYTEGKESTHPVTLGSVLPQSDHLRKHKVEGNRADWPTSSGFHHYFIIIYIFKKPNRPNFLTVIVLEVIKFYRLKKTKKHFLCESDKLQFDCKLAHLTLALGQFAKLIGALV